MGAGLEREAELMDPSLGIAVQLMSYRDALMWHSYVCMKMWQIGLQCLLFLLCVAMVLQLYQHLINLPSSLVDT